MFTIIQDYKNYRQQKKNVKLLKNKLVFKFQNMVKPISFSELNDYKYQLNLLVIGGRAVRAEQGVKALSEYMDEKAPLVHLPSCFCNVFASSYLKPNGFIQSIICSDFADKERSELKEDNVVKCVHNPDDGVIFENHCANCSTDIFRNLIEYHSLKGELQTAQQSLKGTKQKLLNHFKIKQQKQNGK